jgi:dolichol-phosphate mannosyltransferase
MHMNHIRRGGWPVSAMVVVGYAFCLRLLYAKLVELLPEETYYWNYSRHLDIGYLDHPPMVAWLIRAGSAAFGDGEFGVRFGALCCGALAALFVYRLTRNVFGETSALLAVALTQALPFFFLSGLLMTPDAPLTAAWAAALYFLERALIGGSARAWLGVGISIGIGLISKYTIGLLGVAALLFMVLDPPSRRWFRRWEPYAALLIAVCVFAPVLIWNAQHQWASFAFQTSRRLAEAPRFSAHKLVGGAMVLLTPVGLVAAGIALCGAMSGRAQRLLQAAVLVPIAVFAMFSLRHEVKLDWTGAPWTAALPLMAGGFARGAGGGAGRWLRAAWPPTVLAMLLFYGAGLYYLAVGVPGLGYSRHTELVPVGWRDFGRQIGGIADALRAQVGDDLLVVGMDRYAIASELAFYSNDQARSVASTTSAHLFDGVGLMYERWFPAGRQSGRPLLLVAWDPADLAEPHLMQRAAGLGPVEEGVLMRDGGIVRRYYYRFARNYEYP